LANHLTGHTGPARVKALAAAAALDGLRGPLPWWSWNLVTWRSWVEELDAPSQARLRAVIEAALDWNNGAGPAKLAEALRAFVRG
jgi:hypothetical protein